MGRAKRIVLAFRTFGETGQSAFLTQRTNAIAPPGQDFMRIGLMPHVPDDPVGRRVEDVVKRHGQFDHAKSSAEMTSGLRNRIDQFGAQFRCHLREITRRQSPEVGGDPDVVQKRGVGS